MSDCKPKRIKNRWRITDAFYSRCLLGKIFRNYYLVFLFLPFSASAQGPDPDNTDVRSFDAIKGQVYKAFEGTPLKGNHKRALRGLHYWKDRLDERGNLFNHVQANLAALEQLQLYIDTFPGIIQGDWKLIGPKTTVASDFGKEGIGRVNHVAFASAGTWYAGTAGGGLWRTDVAGLYVENGPFPWYPLTDSLPSIAISGIAVDPGDINNIYILTGDGESISFGTRGTQPGVGILKSGDGGFTWDNTSMQWNMTDVKFGYKLVMYPGSADTMLAACDDGLYRTTTGWSATFDTFSIINSRCYDIEFKPGSPDIVYAACLGSLQRSINGGQTFTNIRANLDTTNLSPVGIMGRMAIAVSPDDPDILYVIIARAGGAAAGGMLSFQVSYDSGNTFTELQDNDLNLLATREPDEDDGQGNYDLALWVDPEDASTVMVGGVNIWKSSSYGIAWTKIMDWEDDPPAYTHADIHALETNPFTGDIIAGTDGGLYVSTDGGNEWSNRGHGLAITQYYHLDVWADFLGVPFVSGGAQDNGTSAGVGLEDPSFEAVGGGDGFRTYRGTSDGVHMRYRSVQNGKLYRQHSVEGFWFESEITPEEELDEDDKGKGAWDTPYLHNPNTFDELLAGYDNLYYSNDHGDDWLNFDYPDAYTYDGSQLITEIAWSPSNGNALYFFVADSVQEHLYKCETLYAGVLTGDLELASCTVAILDTNSMMPANNAGGPPSGSRSGRLSDIAITPYDHTEVWISFPGYSDSMKVFYNPDLTSELSWINLSYNLPNVPVHCIEWTVDGLFAGTDIGAFFLHHGDSVWIYYSKGLPTVAVTEIEIRNTISGRLAFASTYGRGIWWSIPPAPQRTTRWYVDSSAVGMNTGIDWANAFIDLQTALDTVFSGDSIWVAKGTYYPESVNGFNLLFDNVRIWGGFNGTEDSVSQRDFVLNPTILSGDIGISGDSLDNANHVFRFGGQNENVLLDGFHVRDGFAKDNGESSNGGGIYYTTGNQSGKPLIANCRIYNNTALGGGGLSNHVGYGAGMYIADYFTGDAPMFIRNCVFENNYSLNRGGGLCIDATKTSAPADTGTAIIYLDSCVFINNTGNSRGGGIFLEALREGVIRLFIDNSLLEGNTLTHFQGKGGGIAGNTAGSGQSGTIELTCTNTDFIGNNLDLQNSEGGAIHVDGTQANVTSTYSNCTFENNEAGEGAAIYHQCSGSLGTTLQEFDHCLFVGNTASRGGALYLYSGFFANSEFNLFNCTFDSNAASGSGGAAYFYAPGAGNFDVVIDSVSFTDNTANENGAIHFQISATTSLPFIPGTLDLTTTNSLFIGNIGDGATDGGAIGLNSSRSLIDAAFLSTDFFNNSTGSQGGAVAHAHTASADSEVSASYTNCSFEGNTAPLTSGNGGGALYSHNSNLELLNCEFVNNVGNRGGAIKCSTGGVNGTYSQSIENCEFMGNKGANLGGALYYIHNDPSVMMVEIEGCTFDSNYTTLLTGGRGGAIYTHGEGRSLQSLSGCTFTDNYANLDGGAMYISRSTGAAVTDTLFITVDSCSFSNNDAGVTGETIEQFANSRVIISHWTNCTFSNDEDNPIFLNKKSSSNTSVAVFADCILEHGPQSLQGPPPATPQLMLPDRILTIKKK